MNVNFFVRYMKVTCGEGNGKGNTSKRTTTLAGIILDLRYDLHHSRRILVILRGLRLVSAGGSAEDEPLVRV